jgi:transposase-like protein
VRAPRINDKRIDEDGNRKRFSSVILPPYMRKSPKVTEVLPLLYLHGLSSGDFVPALEDFFGTQAGLSASTITRLTKQWQTEREHFMARDLSKRDYVYVWVDGIHTGVRLGGDDRLCCLVMVGARLDGMYDYPAEHWRHLRTTNPIESTFAPVRARTDVTKGPGSRQAGLAMIYTLVEASEGRWRKADRGSPGGVG